MSKQPLYPHVPKSKKLEAKPLDSVKDTLEQLEQLPRWSELARSDISGNIYHFLHDYNKLIKRADECEAPTEQLKEFCRFVPKAEALGKEIWNTFEAYGMWTDESSAVVKRIQTTLQGLVTKEFVSHFLKGCRCQAGQRQ